MPQRSPLDYDISVTADKRRRARTRVRGMSGRVEGSEARCEAPGCEARAHYRAPRSPERMNEFRWFCLDHVREYNAAWNYFGDLDEVGFDAAMAADRAWGRRTWTLGQGPKARMGLGGHADGDAWARWGFRDPHQVLGENATLNPGRKAGEPRPRRRLAREEQQAMDVLGLPHQVEARAEVRRRYTELVKELHPDMNGGENAEPERLARVLKAWKVLRKSRNFTD